MDGTTIGAIGTAAAGVIGAFAKLSIELSKIKTNAKRAENAGLTASQDKQSENFWRFVEQLQEDRNWWKEQAEHAATAGAKLQTEMNKLQTQLVIVEAENKKLLEEITVLRAEIAELKGNSGRT